MVFRYNRTGFLGTLHWHYMIKRYDSNYAQSVMQNNILNFCLSCSPMYGGSNTVWSDENSLMRSVFRWFLPILLKLGQFRPFLIGSVITVIALSKADESQQFRHASTKALKWILKSMAADLRQDQSVKTNVDIIENSQSPPCLHRALTIWSTMPGKIFYGY